jgi:serine/alanine adding enzyme
LGPKQPVGERVHATSSARANDIVITRIDDHGERAWDTYVDHRADSTLYHLRAWKRVVHEAYGMKTPGLIARDANGKIRGLLPLYRVPRPFSPYLTSGPFGAYGSILADDEDTARALVEAGCRMVDDGHGRFLHLKLLGDAPSWMSLNARDAHVVSRLDLGESDKALFSRIGSSMRAKVRRAERAGLAPALGRDELDGFYDVLSENMHRKGTPMYGRVFFESLLAQMPGNSTVFTLRLDGKTVSAAFIAWYKKVMYVPFVSSRLAVFPLRANNLLYWEIMRFARAEGCHTLDFGTSVRTSSTFDFKKSWHPTHVSVVSAIYSRDGKMPPLETGDSRGAKLAIKTWAKLPRGFVDRIGPKVSSWVA